MKRYLNLELARNISWVISFIAVIVPYFLLRILVDKFSRSTTSRLLLITLSDLLSFGCTKWTHFRCNLPFYWISFFFFFLAYSSAAQFALYYKIVDHFASTTLNYVQLIRCLAECFEISSGRCFGWASHNISNDGKITSRNSWACQHHQSGSYFFVTWNS